jgi:hypothetical protein
MLKLEVKITDEELKEALSIRCSKVFPAMNMANSFGGIDTTEWQIIRTFSVMEMIKEAKLRNIDLSSIKTEVEVEPLVEIMNRI